MSGEYAIIIIIIIIIIIKLSAYYVIPGTVLCMSHPIGIYLISFSKPPGEVEATVATL